MTRSISSNVAAPYKCANKRDAQLESRCQRFVVAAEKLFLCTGFAGTSVNEIVRLAGGSLTTLYAEFGTKDGWILILQQKLENFSSRWRRGRCTREQPVTTPVTLPRSSVKNTSSARLMPFCAPTRW